MMKIFLNLVILCTALGPTSAQNTTTDKRCLQMFKDFSLSGLPEIRNWSYENYYGVHECKGIWKYNSPQPVKVGCHRTTGYFPYIHMFLRTSSGSIEENTDSKGTDIVLDLTINRNHNGSVIYCKFPRHAIIVEFVYEPNNPSPVDNRPNLLNAISYEIKSYDIGFACDTNTNITVKEGPLMVKISGNYDLVEHIWCQYTVYGADEKPRIFLTQDDFSEYENPKEAITIINAKNFGENKMEWNCTLLTWRGAVMYPTNVYYYEDIYYSRITCLGIVHIVSVAEENTLIFNVNNYNNTCESVEPTQNFTIQEGSTLTVKGFHLLSGEDFYQFWCERFDKNTQKNNVHLKADLIAVHNMPRFLPYAVATIPIQSLHGEFDCFLGVSRSEYLSPYKNESTFYQNTSNYDVLCQAGLNVIGSSTDSSYLHMDITVWICVIVGILIVGLVAATVIYRYWRRRVRNIATSRTENNQEGPVYSEPVYTYVPSRVIPMEQARALAAANRRLPKYESFVPRLPARENDYEYTYISEIRPRPGVLPSTYDEPREGQDPRDEHNQPSGDSNDHYYSVP